MEQAGNQGMRYILYPMNLTQSVSEILNINFY